MVTTPLWEPARLATHEAAGPPTLPGSADVVVVGAGLTGLTTALLLARAGLSVVVVEARHVGAGTTGASTAKLSLLQGTRLSAIARQHDEATVARYVEANREAQAWVMRYCAEHGVGLQRRPAISFASGEAGQSTIRREYETASRAGLDVVLAQELDLPCPHRVGLRLAEQAQVDPSELLAALADDARRRGVVIVERTRVRSVGRGRQPRVATERGEIVAGTVVVATGMPMLDRGAWFARMEPERSYSLALRTTDQPVSAMSLSVDQPSRSLRDAVDAEGRPVLLVGGAGHVTGRRDSPRRALADLRSWAGAFFPDAEETHAWSAQDYRPVRELPFAGPVLPGADRVLVAGGFAKWGMTNGVAAALALTARCTGGRLDWAEVLDPWRRPARRTLGQAASVNGRVGLAMTAGWAGALTPHRRRPGDTEAQVAPGAPPIARARVDGVERQVSAVCTHLGGIVRWNDVERSWDCPLHGSRFDSDGEVLEGPATCGLRRR